jgi:hypothetical protein
MNVLKAYLPADERLANAADENEGDAAVLNLLVLRHVLDKALRRDAAAQALVDACRKADCGEVSTNAVGILAGTKAESHRKPEGQDHADRNRFAVEQDIAETCLRFQGMAEGMAEVQERPLPRLAFIRGDDGGFGRTTDENRPLLRRSVALA